MNEQSAWNQFVQTGKVCDYLSYLSTKQEDTTISEASADADKNKCDCSKAAEYR